MTPVRTSSITLVSKYFWPEKIGSAPYLYDLSVWLREKGHSVTVITARPHYPSTDSFSDWATGQRDQEEISGVRVVRVPHSLISRPNLIGRLRNDIIFARGAYQAIRALGLRESSDSVICLTPTMLALLATQAAFRNSRSVKTTAAITHDIESGLAERVGITGGPMLGWAMRLLERYALRRTDIVFVLTQAMRQELVSIGVPRSSIELMPIWTQSTAEHPTEQPNHGRRTTDMTFMYSGSLGKKQGLEMLIELAAVLSRSLPNARLLIQGEGPEKQKLQAESQRLGLDNIDFRPLAPRAQLQHSLQQADVHVVPQASATADYALPSKLFNIMEAGRAILAICDPDSSISDVVREAGAGLCVSARSPNELEKAILSLAQDSDFRHQCGINGQVYVRRMHDRDMIISGFAQRLMPIDQSPS